MSTTKTVQELVLEICYRAIKTVGGEHGVTSSASCAAIAEALAEKICAFAPVASANHAAIYECAAPDIDTFELFHDLLDEIEKTLPLAGRMNVTVTMGRINLQETERYAPTTTHGGDRGDAENLDA